MLRVFQRSSIAQEVDAARHTPALHQHLSQQLNAGATRTDEVRPIAASAFDRPQVLQGNADGQQKHRTHRFSGLRERLHLGKRHKEKERPVISAPIVPAQTPVGTSPLAQRQGDIPVQPQLPPPPPPVVAAPAPRLPETPPVDEAGYWAQNLLEEYGLNLAPSDQERSGVQHAPVKEFYTPKPAINSDDESRSPRRQEGVEPKVQDRAADFKAMPYEGMLKGQAPATDTTPTEAPVRRNPFKRLDHWMTHHTDGSPINRLRKRNPNPAPAPEMKGKGVHMELGLGQEGQLTFGPGTSPQMQTLLTKTLVDKGRRFEKISTLSKADSDSPLADQESRVLLRDTQGYAHHIRGDEFGMSAMHSSVPSLPGTLPLPDKQHEAQLTHTHLDAQGQAFRLHDGLLMHFNRQKQSWEPTLNPHDQPDKWLSLHSSGNRVSACARHNNVFRIVQLSSQGAGLYATRDPILAHHQDAEGRLAVLGGTLEKQHISLIDPPEWGRKVQLKKLPIELPAHNHPTADAVLSPGLPSEVAISGDHLYVTDKHGALYSITLEEAHKAAEEGNSVRLRHHHPSFLGALGSEQRITGFFTDGRGQLQALVKDIAGQTHACPEAERGNFRPGWNLGDSLVTTKVNGLENTARPEAAIHFDRFGTLRLSEGKVLFRDAVTDSWRTAPGLEGVDALSRGLDGRSYAIVNGKLRMLDIPEKTPVQTLGQTLYSLPSQRHLPKLKAPLRGSSEEDQFISAAVVNSHHYIGLDVTGQPIVRQHSRTNQSAQRQPLALPLSGLPEHDLLAQLHLDKKQNLIGWTQSGRMFAMSKAQWSHPLADRLGSRWEEIALPEGRHCSAESHIFTSGRHDLVLEGSEERYQLNEQLRWQVADEETPPQGQAPSTAFDKTFERLAAADKQKKIKGRDVQFNVGVANFNNVEKLPQVGSGFRERLRAHYVRMNMETPRPLKIAGDAIQHRYQGREGLSDIYREATRLHHELDGMQSAARSRQPVMALDERMTRLELAGQIDDRQALGEDGVRLLDAVRQFRDELDRSSFHNLSLLTAQAKVLDSHGHIKEKAKVKTRQQQGYNHANEHNFTQELKQVWDRNGMSRGVTGKLLAMLDERDVALGHSKSEAPLGRQRDMQDEAAIAKARLTLNTITLEKLGSLLTRLETLADGSAPPSQAQLQTLWEELVNARDTEYRDNPIRRYSDMGHAGFSDLEANYDTIKGFLKAFRKDDHGVTMTSRSALDAKDRDLLKERMKDILHSLREGETLAFGRAYEGGLSTVYMPTTAFPFFAAIMAGATAGVGRSMLITRDEGSMVVSFARNKAQTLSVGGFMGQNLLPLMAGVDVDNPAFANAFQHDINSGRKAGIDIRAAVALSNAFSHAARHGIDFTLSEHDIDSFVDKLLDVENSTAPQDLLEKGLEHVNRHGHTLSFSMDLTGRIGFRAGVDITNSQDNPYLVLRGEAGAVFTGNIAHLSRTEDHERGETSQRDMVETQVSGFDKANATVGLSLQGFTAPKINERGDHLHEYTNFTGIEGKISVEDTKVKQVDVHVRQPGALSFDALPEVIKGLELLFSDKETLASLQAIARQRGGDFNPPKSRQELELHQLRSLSSLFHNRQGMTVDQWRGVRALQKTHTAALAHANHSCVLGREVKYTTTFTNLNRLDHNGLLGALVSHLDPERQPTAAQQLQHIIEHDPQFATLMKSLKETPKARGKVIMELRSEVKQRASRLLAEGRISAADVALLMKDPRNLRIKEIKVVQITGLNESFTPIQFVAGGNSSSSVGMEKLQSRIKFHYGPEDQALPLHYTMMGATSLADQSTREAATSLAREFGQELS
ncbi:AvrE-family type 3 secretion system effector [Pokkaliibacter sp. CJK22405]|uniref:AvrE-family type 3 secretion system effector n=1 Tax=Pokkaliibacter sp. CJK22405 TaxID=3384615 RepID=UPI0039852773